MTAATGFAEMFEWEDGNPTNEDRTGQTVLLIGKKVCLVSTATHHFDIDDIIGVVGGDNTSVAAISNASPDEWHGKHLRDPMNRLLWESQSMVEWIINGYRHWYEADRIPDGITVPKDATYYHDVWNGHKLQREILSEEYKNPGKEIDPYLPRWERCDWAIIVLVGRAPILDKCALNPRWIPMGKCADSVTEYLIR